MSEQQNQQKKTNEKCTCNKELAEVKKQVAELKNEIKLLRLVLRSVK